MELFNVRSVEEEEGEEWEGEGEEWDREEGRYQPQLLASLVERVASIESWQVGRGRRKPSREPKP